MIFSNWNQLTTNIDKFFFLALQELATLMRIHKENVRCGEKQIFYNT